MTTSIQFWAHVEGENSVRVATADAYMNGFIGVVFMEGCREVFRFYIHKDAACDLMKQISNVHFDDDHPGPNGETQSELAQLTTSNPG